MKAKKQPYLFLTGLLCLALVMCAPTAQAANRATIPPRIAAASDFCRPLPPPSGTTVLVSTVSQLENAVNTAAAGTTILAADGSYNLDGVYLRFDTPNVTLRSASGNREAVILDGNYLSSEIIQIVASDITIADLTLREAYYHPIHVMSREDGDTLRTLIYNVHIIDPGEQAIKINPYAPAASYYPDDGVVACSHIELTSAGRPHIRNNCYTGGVDAHQARNWTIRDNRIEGFWCASGLSEHAIHMWVSCRDTLVERNVLSNNARGVGFGLQESGSGRTYPDDPCPSAGGGYVDHYGGVIRNNFIFANDSSLFASEYGFDCGICLWQACGARVLHNTVVSTQAPFSSIEWRFERTNVTLLNNLVSHNLRDRGGVDVQAGNLQGQPLSLFVDGSGGDLHLASSAAAAINQVSAPADVTQDIDGDPRPVGSASDVGADEYPGYGFSLQAIPASQAILPGQTAAFTLDVQPVGGYSGAAQLVFASPSPGLLAALQPTSGGLPFQATLTITDTHSGTLLPGVWYSLPITATSGSLAQSITLNLLVGGARLYLPRVSR